MDTDEIIIWVCLAIAVLLLLLFFFFAMNTGGVKEFAIYILFPLFVISFLIGMALLIDLIVKLNDKIDNNSFGLNKKIDTNNFMIKDSISNVDDYLQNVDYTVIINDRNIPVDIDDPDSYPTEIRYHPKTYEPSLEIPGVTGPEGIKDLSEEIITENNVKSVILNEVSNPMISIENNTKEQNIDIKDETSNPILSVENIIEEKNIDLIEDNNSVQESLPESLSINETLIDDNSISGTIDDLMSIPEPFEYYEIMEENEDEPEVSADNESVFTSSYNIDNLYEINMLHEEFKNSYNLFED
jgi:hypothetical protein